MRRHGAVITAAICAVIVLIDQVTKAWVRATMVVRGASIPVLGDVVRLFYVRNEGASFGMMPGYQPLFITVSLCVLVAIAAYVVRRRPQRRWIVIALGLVAGGALANLIDRVAFGWVTDFIRIPFDFPIFNIADSAVVVGVAMLVWWLLFGPAPGGPSAASDAVSSDAPADASAQEPEAH